MKPSLIIATMVMLSFASSQIEAQHNDASRVKILPTTKAGVVKLHYAIGTDEPIAVKFIAANGYSDSDKIKGRYPLGVSKRYDVRHINDKDYWIEIKSSHMTLMYHVVTSENGKAFTPYLEKTIYNHPVVAVKN